MDPLVFMPYGLNPNIRKDYCDKLRQHSLEPCIVRYDVPMIDIRAAYERSDAVMLLGGSDVNPRRYDAPLSPLTNDMDDLRDRHDLTTLDWAYADRKPILGICRGAQLMWVHRGGKLMQHIPEFLSPTTEMHSTELVPQTTGSLTSNNVLIMPGTLLSSIVRDASLDVMCAHHQSIALPPMPGRLRIAALSHHGVVEAIEGITPDHFVLGVQFHPEVTNGKTDNIFKAFYDAAVAYAHRLLR